MSDTNETIADIIAEMRFHAQQNIDAEKDKPEYGFLTVEGRSIQSYADRLEAAHKRELIEVATRAATQGVKLTNEKYANMPIGNSAALREALVRVQDWLKRMNAEPLNTLAVSELTPSYAVNRTAKSIIEDNDYHISQLTAALAAPPRNCDRFGGDIDKLREACARERGLNPEEDFPDVFPDWLLALAQKGGAK